MNSAVVSKLSSFIAVTVEGWFCSKRRADDYEQDPYLLFAFCL